MGAREPFIINQGQVCRVFVCVNADGGFTYHTVAAAHDITQPAPGFYFFFFFSVSFRFSSLVVGRFPTAPPSASRIARTRPLRTRINPSHDLTRPPHGSPVPLLGGDLPPRAYTRIINPVHPVRARPRLYVHSRRHRGLPYTTRTCTKYHIPLSDK